MSSEPAESTPGEIHAPWTDEQVDALNYYQESGAFHPFTCGNRGDGKHIRHLKGDLGQLIATRNGWICLDCNYTQTWAHAQMADREMVAGQVAWIQELFGGR